MPKPEEIKIQAKTINSSAEEIIGVLEDTSKGNVIFVRGWHGFGASAALKAVARRLKSSKSKFDRVIHVDCSVWKSMRALQKAFAEELELPPSVMAIFDWCDEEDDFSGIDEGSRGVIADIRTEIYRRLANSRFVVIFHNGSDEYIDVYQRGVPVISIFSNKVLWTWHGRFRPDLYLFKAIKAQENMGMHTDVVINYFYDDCIRDEAILEEVKEVVTYMGNPGPYMNHMIVEKCFQYAYALGSLCYPNYLNWQNHVTNFLVCDGIIQGQGDTSAWGVADALQRNMHLDSLLGSTKDDIHRHLQCRLRDRWVLEEHKKGKLPDEIGMVLSEATSFFVLPNVNQEYYQLYMTLPDDIFQVSHSSKLRVLQLFFCRFSFETPPFRCCSQLRFLLLDACKNIASGEHPSHHKDMSCFPGVLPPSLESFTFKTRFTSHEKSCSSISFRGCSQLKSILLEGYQWGLEELDLSGTIVKILDLREVITPKLKRLILLGCEKLCAILWPRDYYSTQDLEVLHINTIRSTSPCQANWEEKSRDPIAAMGSSSILVATATELGISPHAPFEVKWYISATDTRILRSLEPVKKYIEHSHLYMEMGSSPTSGATVGDNEAAQGIPSRCQPDNYSYARDVFFQSDLQDRADNEGAISWMWDCPASPTPRAQDWYLHIQDKAGGEEGTTTAKTEQH